MPDSMLGLQDKVVVITGGSRGVGRGCALQFAQAGAHVVIAARGIEDAEKTAADVRAMGRDAIAVRADIRVEGDVETMIKAAMDRFGRIDVGINNAAGRADTGPAPVVEADPSVWRETMEMTFQATLFNARAFALAMIDKGVKGAIVNVGSVAGFKATPTIAAYGAAKAAVVSITKTLAYELAPHGIRVNGIAPGMVATESLARFLTPEVRAARVATIPLGRIAEPIDLAKAVVMMSSDLAQWVTGQMLIADGGQDLRPS